MLLQLPAVNQSDSATPTELVWAELRAVPWHHSTAEYGDTRSSRATRCDGIQLHCTARAETSVGTVTN